MIEEEEEEIQMIIDSNSIPAIKSSYDDTSEIDSQDEEILHWRTAKVCHCSSCFNKLIEKLPNPPKTALEIKRSQSLNNFYDTTTRTNLQPGFQRTTIPSNPFKIQTRERDTMRTVTFGNEILSFQGTIYSPEDIALTWKKDCRMWLWKSTRA